MIDFSTWILLLDFSVNTYLNRVIFDYVNFSWSFLSKFSKIPNSSSDLIEFEEYLENSLFLSGFNAYSPLY